MRFRPAWADTSHGSVFVRINHLPGKSLNN